VHRAVLPRPSTWCEFIHIFGEGRATGAVWYIQSLHSCSEGFGLRADVILSQACLTNHAIVWCSEVQMTSLQPSKDMPLGKGPHGSCSEQNSTRSQLNTWSSLHILATLASRPARFSSSMLHARDAQRSGRVYLNTSMPPGCILDEHCRLLPAFQGQDFIMT
jgi:hypothetical protein